MARAQREPAAVHEPGPLSVLLQQHLSPPRLSTFLRAAGGDLDRAVELYRWNAAVAGALWEALGHGEVVLRNAVHDALTARHERLGRPDHWYDDPAHELEQRARDDIAAGVRRIRRAGGRPEPGKVVAELPFGFWRYLLARRYTATLWPAVRRHFPHLAGSDRRLLEAPVARLHQLRNRVAHHEPLLAEDLPGRYTDLLTLVGAVDPRLRDWVERNNRLTVTIGGDLPAG